MLCIYFQCDQPCVTNYSITSRFRKLCCQCCFMEYTFSSSPCQIYNFTIRSRSTNTIRNNASNKWNIQCLWFSKHNISRSQILSIIMLKHNPNISTSSSYYQRHKLQPAIIRISCSKSWQQISVLSPPQAHSICPYRINEFHHPCRI